MAVDTATYRQVKTSLDEQGITLVAVSKLQPEERILALYKEGQRDFGENYVQELVAKEAALPKDIRWHFIGHLQSNKVKYIAPFVWLIHGVDSIGLLKEINKQAIKNNRTIDVLLQVHIAEEETKFGLDENGLQELLQAVATNPLGSVRIRGLMGMASFSDDEQQLRSEFGQLKELLQRFFPAAEGQEKPVLSMGMSSDYQVAITEGSTMVRIGSLLFGARL